MRMAADTEDSADVAAAEGEGEEGLPKRKKWSGKRLVLFIGLPAILLIIATGAGLYFTGMLGGAKKVAEEAPKVEAGPGVYVDLPEILVNLETTGKQQRFLKTSISLEVANAEQAEALKKVMPRLIDQFQTYLRGLRVDDFRGSSGVYRLRQELLSRVAQSSGSVPVNDVLFKELLVQ